VAEEAKKQGFTDHLEIIPQYPGTNSVDNQGPTPGTPANSWLTLELPLDPFKLSEGGKERPYTSLDCINIEKQLGYTYGPGSLDQQAAIAAAAPAAAGPGRTVLVSGINRGAIGGSFLISAFANVGGTRQHLGTEAVLSRWHVEGCANCQVHLEARAAFSAPVAGAAAAAPLTAGEIEVEVRTRHGLLGDPALAAAAPAAAPRRKPFRVELR
jgi:tyrosinase